MAGKPEEWDGMEAQTNVSNRKAWSDLPVVAKRHSTRRTAMDHGTWQDGGLCQPWKQQSQWYRGVESLTEGNAERRGGGELKQTMWCRFSGKESGDMN